MVWGRGDYIVSMEISCRDLKIVQTRRLRSFNSPAMLHSITSRALRSVMVLLTVSSMLYIFEFWKTLRQCMHLRQPSPILSVPEPTLEQTKPFFIHLGL